MTRLHRLLNLLVLLCGAAVAHAQTCAFNDAFAGGSTVNSNPANPVAPSSTVASYQQLSVKAFSPNPPAVTSGNLRFGIVATSSGFNELQALFTQYPVALVNAGDYIELKVTFATEGGIITPQTSSGLFFGLYNAGQVQPIPGGLNGTEATATAGYAQNWQGYVNRLYYAGGANAFTTRPAQSATATNNQDVLYSYTGSVTVGSTATSTLAAFTAKAAYTEVFRITKGSGSGLMLAGAFYAGTSASGTPLYTQTATSSSSLTATFDAFALGWRATGSVASIMNIASVTIATTGRTTITPAITTQPLSVTKSIGESVTFTVGADGGSGTALAYQWQKDGAAIAGATDATYAIPSVGFGHAANYTVVVSDVAGATTSAAATLTVTAGAVPPTVVVPPAGGTIVAGGSFSFSATVNGTAPLTFQWQRSTDGGASYNDIPGATDTTYVVSNATIADSGMYRITATNAVGTATSASAALVVTQAPSILAQPLGGAIAPGQSLTLTVSATGTPAPTYQWKKNGVTIPGATSASYTISSASGADTGNYTVVASNVVGTVTSSTASVAVISQTFAATSVTPASADARNPDVRLTITFNQAPIPGVSGGIRIYDAATKSIVDTVDLVAATALRDSLRPTNPLSTQLLPVQVKTIGGVTSFNYYPITVSGNTATIYPRNGVLSYGRTYYVQIDPGAFVNASGEAFPGISDDATWRFSTKAAAPATGVSAVVVAADGSGDFDTVQGALDFVPANNTTPIVVNVRKGTYFEEVVLTSKHYVTLIGEDSAQTVVAYPNNAAFNSAPGAYHRATLFGNGVHDFTLGNLTVNNTTPQNGTQAEALILTGTSATAARNIVAGCRFCSYQDTIQINNQTYVTDSTIVGDVDFMWGGGPVFLQNCDIRIVRSGAYFTQIRNGSGNHGYVFSNCRFTAPAGVTGTFLGRIDPTAFPYSEVVVVDSTMGDATNNAFLASNTGPSGSSYLGGWWVLNNASSSTPAANVHDWTNTLVDGNGAPLSDPNGDAFTSMPTDATTQANYRDPSWVLNTNMAGAVLGTWKPGLAPSILSSPKVQTANAGDTVTFTVSAFGVPAPTYQWQRNGAGIPGATAASLTITEVTGTDADSYAVVVSNAVGSVTSSAATLVVNGGPPVIAQQPEDTPGLRGANATLNTWAVGNGPFSYQWMKDGIAIAGATNLSLRLLGIHDVDAGVYSVAITNGAGTTTSRGAQLTLVEPAMALPTVPSIPAGTFDVTQYGAVGDGVTDSTKAIQAAIDSARAAGGGTVELPPARGAYQCGPITLYSHMNLQVDAGATLRALPYGVYPNSYTAPSHFVNVAANATDVEFSGGGTIDGDGGAWWAAYAVTGPSTPRFRLVQISTVTNMLVTGITFSNSPTFHLAYRGANNNVTIFGATVSAPGNAPNTDGMDICGTNILVQNCSVSDGDDDIVAKPGGTFCRNICIANCAIGNGHGVSIGGQTNVGLDGMVVKNCTFNGTSSAIRFKADATQGGPVQNVTFENITMTNVLYPILFYSYYNQLGSPGATSGSSRTTSTKVNAWNATPPNPLGAATIPIWKNIVVRNLTVINGSGYSTIWGLPLANALIQNVTLENVNISGGAGLELYDATNIQLVGTNNVGPILTCNALAITGQPVGQTINAGESVSFTASAVGGSGTNNTGLGYRWMLNGAPLTDGVQPDGSSITGSTTTTLTIANARVSSAGSYALSVSTTLDGYDVTAGSLGPNSLPVSATSSAALLTVNPLPATITLTGLLQVYDGTAKAPSAITVPASLPVQFAWAGGMAPVNAGSHGVTATIADPNYVGSATATLTIAPAQATVVLGALAQTYDGTARKVTVSTSPSGLPVAVTYGTSSELPINAGSYGVAATVTDPNYIGSDAQTLVVRRATPTLTVTPYSVTFDAQPHVAVGSAIGVRGELLAGLDLAGTIHAAAGTYNDTWRFADVTGNYLDQTGTQLDVIKKAAATITLSGLTQQYDGTPRVVVATTEPAGLAVDLTFDGSPIPPVYPGRFAVNAVVDDKNYAAVAEGTLRVDATVLIRDELTLSGTIDGSVQLIDGRDRAISGHGTIASDLLLPGLPQVRISGNPTCVGISDASGASTPNDYAMTLSGNSLVRYVVRRVDPVELPVLSPLTDAAGSRSVKVNRATDAIGDATTLRDLTINGNAGAVALPPGAYNAITVNGGSTLVLGVPGSAAPVEYDVQELTLNGAGSVRIVSPVLLRLGNGVLVGGHLGAADHPDWLALEIVAGDLTLNGKAAVYGSVVAPKGRVTVNASAILVGTVQASDATVNGGGVIQSPRE